MPPLRIGELLVAEGLLTPAAVSRALGFQKSAAPRVKLGSILLTWDLIDEGNLLKALAALHRCEAVTGDMLTNAPVDVVRMLPAAHAIRLNAVPYALHMSRIRVAFVNPSDIGAIDEVAAVTGHVCVPGVVTELRLLQAHRRFYGRAIPTELRPVVPRARPAQVARPEGARASATAAFTPIPVSGKLVAGPGAGDPSPIRIPELPIPPHPTAARRENPTTQASSARPPAEPVVPAPAPPRGSDQEQTASALWVANLPEGPQSEAVRGMWSHAAAPTPAEDLGDLALAAVPLEFPRAILMADREGILVGWRARGLDPRALEAIRVSSVEPSIFASVVSSGTPHFGRVEPELWPDSFAKLLDGPPPCAVFPVQSGHGVSAVLYADRRGAPMKFEDTTSLARAAAEIASLFARVSAGTAH
jgi:hypothetical protein